MKIAIIIPARYGSTRFPGKPLARIGDMTMLERVVNVARQAIINRPDCKLAVATEDQRIIDHCIDIDVECVMTSEDCASGSDRVLEAAKTLGGDFDFIFNLQGDAPFTPLGVLDHMIEEVENGQGAVQVITPVVRLRWDDLDNLRNSKKITPFSGTTCIRASDGRALWFSKNILPAIRKENRDDEFSPVYQHIGLYGYRMDVLEKYVSLPQGHYEQLEGLEQLRFLENDIPIQTVEIEVDMGMMQAGIDSPEDLERAQAFLND